MNFDYRGFHPNCTGVTVLSGSDGMYVVCPVCRVAANIEAISAKVSPADACLVGKEAQRTVVGEMSAGVKI